MFFKRKKSKSEHKPEQQADSSPLEPAVNEPQGEKATIFERIKRGLNRTSSQLSSGLSNLLMGKKAIDDDLLEEIETLLLMADVGIEATADIIDDLTERTARKQLADSEALFSALKQSLLDLLKDVEAPLVVAGDKKPYVILVVGVNGVGKTTTIGKLAKRLQNEGKSVMLAAGDTFRAAAVEQLQVWGERNDVPVVAQHSGADSASVIFDAVQSAQSRGIDVVIADTAGRLHNKSNLMEELSKVKRVMGKLDDSAPHEVLLVLDAGTGQNAVSQAEQFRAASGVSGLVLTKLDGTAKGGIIFALSKRLSIPVRFIGVGEGIDDLQPFHAERFIDALFNSVNSEA
ncbi:signal recognition particle-docking protein FtsY [Alteromonadaceae bacterium Bs31]|nr:signal recognition particle-docking protein FtsY [Alteromonadaceae bacterium Bs31]